MASIPLSVLTWNINFRAASVLDPLAALPKVPDIVTLQEVTLDQASVTRERSREPLARRPSTREPDERRHVRRADRRGATRKRRSGGRAEGRGRDDRALPLHADGAGAALSGFSYFS